MDFTENGSLLSEDYGKKNSYNYEGSLVPVNAIPIKRIGFRRACGNFFSCDGDGTKF